MGQALCRSSVTEASDLRVLIRSAARLPDLPVRLRGHAAIGDLMDAGSLVDACDSVDTILHLAGEAHVGDVQDDPNTHPIVTGARNLLAAAERAGVRRIVFLSSSLAESAATGIGDVTTYGRAKLAAETVFSAATARSGIKVIILRPVNIYGTGMKGNIAGMISMIAGGRLPPLPPINSRISLVSVQDVVQAIILATTCENSNGRTFTLTDGQAYAVSEVEAKTYQLLGKTPPRWRTPAVILYVASAVAGLLNQAGIRRSSISVRTYRNLMNDNLFDNAAICSELGFEPSMTLYDALPEIVENIKASER